MAVLVLVSFLVGFVNSKYIIAVNEEPPFASCETEFSGYEVDIVREALTLLNWRYIEDYEFVCNEGNSSYDAVVGRVLMKSSKIKQGYKYSVPTHNGKLSILQYQKVNFGSYEFLSLFSLGLWGLILGTIFVSGLFIWLFESGNKNFETGLKGFLNGQWAAVSAMLFSRQLELQAVATRILVTLLWVFAFLLTAIFYSLCTYTYLEGHFQMNYPEKLAGKKYITTESYLEFTSQYKGLYRTYNFTISNYEPFVEKLRDGSIEAIVLETELLKKIAGEECDMVLAGEPFSSFLYAVEINPSVDSQLKEHLDWSIKRLYELKDINKLKSVYFSKKSPCNTDLVELDSWEMGQFSELWLFMGGFLLFVFFFRSFLKKREVKNERKKHLEEIKSLMSRPETKILKATEKMARTNDLILTKHIRDFEAKLRRLESVHGRVVNILKAEL